MQPFWEIKPRNALESDPSSSHRGRPQHPLDISGFSLAEMLMALLVLTFGLLAVSQLLFMSLGSASLTRSKLGAAAASQDRLEALAYSYRQDPDSADLTIGSHGPIQSQILNPGNGILLNRYHVYWTVGSVPDPRPGKELHSRRITVSVIPVNAAGEANRVTTLNKALSISTILSPGSE